MKLTNFIFFYDTPLIDFSNTIHFSSNAQRDNFFLVENHFSTLEFSAGFNFVRDRQTISINFPYEKCQGINYCTFLNGFDNKRYYAFVMKQEYINDKATKMYLLIDTLMTFTQGKILETLKNVKISRMHYKKADYEKNLYALRNNMDILKCTDKQYIRTDVKYFKDFYTVFTAAVDITADPGSEKDPKLKTSTGSTYDKLPSPLNLYLVETKDFPKLVKAFSKYPWIAQNFKENFMIPKELIDSKDMETVSGVKGDNPPTVKRLTDNGKSQNIQLDALSLSFSDLMKLFNLDENEDKHLLRNEYTTTEIYSYNGQEIFIDNGKIPTSGKMNLWCFNTVGYFNEFVFFYKNYLEAKNSKTGTGVLDGGQFLNNAIVFDSFNELPMLIDNYKLSKANNAHQRQLAESKLVSNRINNVFDSSADKQDRFYNAASLLSNLSPSDMFGKFSDEYEFYRTQKAEFADLAISSPTITAQNDSNSFQISNDIYGLTKQHATITDSEWEKVKRYYKMMGYEVEDYYLPAVESMTVANYLQFSGNWQLNGIDTGFNEMLKAQLENGVRFWHNNGSDNPMNQNIMNNKMKG